MAKKISIEDAIKIRQQCNPLKTFGPGVNHGDLAAQPYLTAVESFNQRINVWYFSAGEYLDKGGDYNLPLTILCCVIIDLLSQFVYGDACSSGKSFKKFIKQYLKDSYQTINPPIISCYYDNSKGSWFEEVINDTADAFYHCFRCGVVHSGRILEYGRVNKNHTQVFTISIWDRAQNYKEITVNAVLLTKKLQNFFNEYINYLKICKEPFTRNFKKKFYCEYGIKL